MARPATRYACTACGAVAARRFGRCEACGEWNALVEEAAQAGPQARRGKVAPIGLVSLAGESAPEVRTVTGIGEFDRVLGGGFVPASVALVGGDPGIGKSTLLLQAAAALARTGRRVLHVSGEESIAQVRLRAQRLGLAGPPVELAAAIDLNAIAGALERISSSSIRFRRCGSKRSNRRPAR